MVGGPFYLKFWGKLTLLERKRRFSIDIRSYRLSRNYLFITPQRQHRRYLAKKNFN